MADQVGGATYVLDIDSRQFVAGAQQAEAVKQQLVNGFKQVDAATAKTAASQKVAAATSHAFDLSLTGVGRTAFAVALGMGGLNIAVTAASTALRGTIQAAADDAASQAELRAAVDASGGAYDQYSQTLDEVIRKGQQRGFSDDQTRQSLSLLIASTGSITEATKRYAIAQDLARGANIDITNSARILARINEENLTALQRYGVSVQGAANETEVLAAVEAKFAGQAQAFAESSAGQFARTKDAIAEAGEAIGRLVLPVTAQAAQGLTTAADKAGAFADELDGAAGVAGELFPSLITGAAAFGAALAAIKFTQFISDLRAVAALRAEVAASADVSGLAKGSFLLTGEAINPLTAGLAAATVGVIGLDVAVRHYTGSGIIDYLTGQAKAHQRAADAAAHQKEVEDGLTRAQREGLTLDQAKQIQLTQIINDANAAVARLATEQTALNSFFTTSGRAPFSINIAPPAGAAGPQLPSLAGLPREKAALQEAADKIIALKLDYRSLLEVIAQAPALTGPLTDEINAQRDALSAAAAAAIEDSVAINTLKDAQSELSASISNLTGLADFLEPGLEALKLQKLQLEQLKTQLGDTFGAANQAKLDTITRQIDLLTGRHDLLRQALTVVAAQIAATYGEGSDEAKAAAAAINRVNVELAGLPDETRLKIEMILPDLEMHRLLDFLSFIQQGFTVPVALQLATQTPAQTAPNRFTRGTFGDQGVADAKANADAQALLDIAYQRTKQAADDLTKSVGPLGPSAAKAGAGATAAESDLLALARAFALFHEQTGGTIDDFNVALKIGSDRLALDQRMHDAEIALRVSQEEATDGLYQLDLGLVAIAEHLAQTGETVNEFLRDVNAGVLASAKSMVDQLLGGPTREGAQMQLKIDTLQRQADLLKRGGAVDTVAKGQTLTAADRQLIAIEGQIKALREEQQLRQDDLAIMKDQALLADKTLQTDSDLVNADRFLIGVIDHLSGTVHQLDDAMFGLLSGKSGGASVPQLAAGIHYVPRPMLAMLDPGERVLTAAENRAYGSPGGAPSGPLATFSFHITASDEAAIRRQVNAALDEGLARARRGGSLPPAGAFT